MTPKSDTDKLMAKVNTLCRKVDRLSDQLDRIGAKDDPLLTTEDAIKIFKCSPTALANAIKSGDIPAAKVLNKWRMRHSDIYRYFARIN